MEAGPASALPLMPENHQIVNKSLKVYKRSPPPWKLMGEGFMFIYRFQKDWVEENGLLPYHLKGQFRGGLGYVMLVNYAFSPVGAYNELLFIPGKFGKEKKHAITKIYVDKDVSTYNGQANWGIPKETLPIAWEKAVGQDIIKISDKDKEIFSCEVKSGGLPFPASTSFLPIDLHQVWNGVDYFTKPSGSGTGRLAKILNLSIDPTYFPDISTQKPLLAVKISPFRVKFPLAKYAV